MSTNNTFSDTPIIKVIGVGGGGGNAVNNMYKQGIVGVDFAICNTDAQAMANSEVPTKIALGPLLTQGLGAGAKPEKGKEACIESIDAIRDFLSDNTKMLFITAGMGGGTGTGAAPIIAKAAKEMGILTVAIVTLPIKFEGMKRHRQALEGLEQLKKNIDSVLVISNDKLIQASGDITLDEAFSKADDVLTTAAKGIAEIITLPGRINVDFADVHSVMKDSGVAIMGCAMAEGSDRATEAIKAAVNSPLLEDNDIRGAKNILVNIAAGDKGVSVSEFNQITSYIQEEAGYGTDIFWGDCRDSNLGDKISITFIATGFKEGKTKDAEAPTITKVSLEDNLSEITGESGFTFTESATSNTVEFSDDDVQQTIDNLGVRSVPLDENMNIERNRRSSRDEEFERLRRENLRNTTSVALDSPQIISELENVPAYERRRVTLEDVDVKNDREFSRYSVDVNDDGPVIKRNNSFLHDNVD